jgi:hypothetical protein
VRTALFGTAAELAALLDAGPDPNTNGKPAPAVVVDAEKSSAGQKR